MRGIPAVLVLAGVLAIAAAQTSEGELPEGQVCLPGSRWKDDCNWCFCSENGVAGCHLKLCVAGLPEEEGPTCHESSVWRQDCNICSCSNGLSRCTRRLCPEPEGVVPVKPVKREAPAVEDEECQGDSQEGRWREECNWCRCIKGRGVCTRRGCPPFYETLLLSSDDGQKECEGIVSWKKDCNTCSCANGRGICTTKLCVSLDEIRG